MVGFGELRRLSLKWQADIATVERAYALDWLLKAIFERQGLSQAIALHGPSALSKLYFQDYPPVGEAELFLNPQGGSFSLETELGAAGSKGGVESGLDFKLQSLKSSVARFEFTGPMGRRSAAQPVLVLRFDKTPFPHEPLTLPIIHPFSERFDADARAISLEQAAAGYIVMLGERPRARDVFDLWFVLSHASGRLNYEATRELAQEMWAQKGRLAKAELDPAHRPLLERAWERGIKEFPGKPTFAQTENEIKSRLADIIS